MGNEILFLEPVLTHNIWGGERLRTEFGYNCEGSDIGECWGIAAHKNGDATIKNGDFAGQTLSHVFDEHRELFGNVEGDRFPLLIKIIDAKDNLSIQVHPNDEYARVNENGSLGKTECWYILDCPENATLVAGHNAKTKDELTSMIKNGKWNEFIREIPVKKGDFIQINPGTVHAIKGGILLLETQQNSDITYRVYDYDRLSNGKPRELHVEKSIDVINVPAASVDDSVKHFANTAPNSVTQMYSCIYYNVSKVNVDGSLSMDNVNPFINMSVVEGEGCVNGVVVKKGDHFIVTSLVDEVKFEGKMELIISTM